MPIPDLQTAMLPLLKHLSDGKEHSNQDTLKTLADHFNLSDNELAQLLPSGYNRYLRIELPGQRAASKLLTPSS